LGGGWSFEGSTPQSGHALQTKSISWREQKKKEENKKANRKTSSDRGSKKTIKKGRKRKGKGR